MAGPVHAALGDRWIHCRVCGGDRFRKREVQLNSFGMEFLKLSWADETATGLICWDCGYVHLFANRRLTFHKAPR